MPIEMLIIAALLSLGLFAIASERRLWNGGICKKNGRSWEYFDTDSQGGRGYQAGGQTCWISYPQIDR